MVGMVISWKLATGCKSAYNSTPLLESKSLWFRQMGEGDPKERESTANATGLPRGLPAPRGPCKHTYRGLGLIFPRFSTASSYLLYTSIMFSNMFKRKLCYFHKWRKVSIILHKKLNIVIKIKKKQFYYSIAWYHCLLEDLNLRPAPFLLKRESNKYSRGVKSH